jgi:hypothetical protein
VIEQAMRRSPHLLAGAAALSFGLTACGGGGAGGGVASIPPPPVTPTPSPTPTPTPTGFSKVDIFPALKTSTEFAVLGLEAPGTNATTLTKNGFSVHYDAATNSYAMDFPSAPAGSFEQYSANSPNARWWGGALLDSSGHPVVQGVNVLKPSNPDLQLTYTTLVEYGIFNAGGQPFGVAAFGTSTPQGAVPVTGSATYSALIAGATTNGLGVIGGSANLAFDFGAGALAGHMDPYYISVAGLGEHLPLASYDFVNTVYSTGSTSFSGQLSTAGITEKGSFDGLFTGPAAQELMARWSAPYLDPTTNSQSQMFGVWVGTKK